MDNPSSQFPSFNQNQKFVSQPSINPETFIELESQGDDWNIRDFLDLIRRRALIIAGVATVVMSYVVYSASKQQPIYESNFRLLVEPLNAESKLPDLGTSQQNSGNNPSLDYDSQIEVLKSPQLIKSIVDRLQAIYPDIDYGYLVNSLNINRLGETKIIEVSYRAEDPTQIKTVLDQVAKTYLKYSLEQRQTSLRQGLRFADDQLRTMQQRVDQLQKEQQLFRQRYDWVDPGTQASLITSQSSTLLQQRQEIDKQLAAARANLARLQKEDGQVTALIDAPLYQQLLGQLRQLDVQIATSLTRFQEENPTIQTLREQRESLLPLLQQEARRYMDTKFAEAITQVQALEVQSQEIARAEQQLEQKQKQLPVLTRQYTELQRKLEIANDSLNRFLKTRESLQIQVAQAELPWELIQAPVKPDFPVAPDLKRNLMTGLIASLALGIGAAFLLEKLDTTYHSVGALKRKIKEPLLGSIPFEKQLQSNQFISFHPSIRRIFTGSVPDTLPQNLSDHAAILERYPNGYGARFLEALRVLYTNIQLLTSDRPIRSVVISSAMNGDGKSTVAFNLAQIACAMGQRVLLVDADLRQPTIHTLSNLNNQWGLSNLISTNVPYTEAIRPASFMENLSILTAGPIPPDPTKLLSSEKMKRLMEEFHNSFDIVIYDAPPVVGLADATLLTPNTDGILMVVRMDKTDSSVLKRALDSLKMARINVLGIVSNGQKRNIGNDY